MNESTVKIISALITLAVALITTFLLPLIREKTTLTQRENALVLVNVAVGAAEQLYKSLGKEFDRKAWVLAKLEQYNIKMSASELDVLIESAVYELNQAQKELLKE